MANSADDTSMDPISPLDFGPHHRPLPDESAEKNGQEESNQQMPQTETPPVGTPISETPTGNTNSTTSASSKPSRPLTARDFDPNIPLEISLLRKTPREVPPPQPGYPPFDPYTIEGYNDDAQIFYLNRRRGTVEVMPEIPDYVLIKFEVMYKKRWFLPESFYMPREVLIPRYQRWVAKNPDKKIL
jgi:hypothetical protein